MFSMTLETKQKNSLDGQIKTKRENIRVKVIDVLFVGLTLAILLTLVSVFWLEL